MKREEEFKIYLENKYGQTIRDLLYKEGKLITKNIIEDKHGIEGRQKMVQNQLKTVKKSVFNLKYDKDNKWAFDFPGWIGKLDFEKDNLKKYMVIGLEPHIERFDFQITYGLSDNTPVCNSKRFSIDTEKDNFVQCKNDSSLIWTNFFKLLATDFTKTEVLENKNERILNDFLNQFYITDLCYFAPKGNANLIKKVSNWSKIRKSVATEFIKNEIEIINPKIILAQGTEVFNLLKKTLEIDEYMTYSLGNGSIRVARFGNIKVISLPHIGSTMIHRTFWMNNINNVRVILEKKQILTFE